MEGSLRLEGRVALITGGGRGIGRGIAECLARDGAAIAVNFRRDEASAVEMAHAARALGRRAGHYRADVAAWSACEAMVAQVLKDFGKIDILVNNAGIASRGQSVTATDPAEMERVVRTHGFSAFYLSKLVVPQMRALGRGDVVMISSSATTHTRASGASTTRRVARSTARRSLSDATRAARRRNGMAAARRSGNQAPTSR